MSFANLLSREMHFTGSLGTSGSLGEYVSCMRKNLGLSLSLALGLRASTLGSSNATLRRALFSGHASRRKGGLDKQPE